MSENKAFRNSLIKLGLVCICAILYAVGGMGFLAARRFIAPTVCVGSMFYFSKNWRSLIQLPFMMFSNAIGYGADLIWVKIFKRGLFGLVNGVTSSGYNILIKKWTLVILQILLLTGVCITLGVWNQIGTARAEEMIIGLFMYGIPIFSITEHD